MSEDRRRRLTPQERRAQLVALGVNFLASRPLDELTIEELSEQAEVSRGLVFHYFGSRQGLHREVVLTARDSLLRASEPRPELPALERLHDTLARIVVFVREHRGTFYSLVRGVASGDPAIREVIDQSRDENARRLLDVFIELGMPQTELLRVALRAWVGFTEEVLVELAVEAERPVEEIVDFLERSVHGVVAAVGRGR
ncbi:TetR/AcrR family transcriptional regulator [Microbacterium horticulturae]|uniref:TetR/AcrR family transcriptional regulator n=1 Tax=Microbacterium horticulturae TaxID=3028316 RepID=A0ABY8BWZ1_9MICO|nr:TetR/AcrR family transcriptional regulator [Microbacterium sp. KACC 23027]WEG08711.1 TetR/AcrR family transcriptional regulator [Microbacterium sp. KACC 23027]